MEDQYFPARRFDHPSPEYVPFSYVALAFAALAVSVAVGVYCFWIAFTRSLRSYDRLTPAAGAATVAAEIELQGTSIGPPTPAGVDPDVRRQIPQLIYGSDNGELPYREEKCACCQFEFMGGESVSILPNCRHSFHSSCIFTHMTRISTCPCCRRHISLQDNTGGPA